MIFKGALRLFRLFGIDVYLHWSWVLLLLYELQARRDHYQSQAWNVLELVTVFVIVLIHEFGHATACLSTGGIANRILLWPFGGIAFVQPPMRPGAQLWTTVAGPLVNVVLIPVTYAIRHFARTTSGLSPDASLFFEELPYINWLLLIFNLIPIYPLDGGQILRDLLWFVVGPIQSLRAAAIVGLVGIAGVVGLLLTFSRGNYYMFFIAFLGVMQCLRALQIAKTLEQNPELLDPQRGPVRRPQLRCPACGQAAPIGNFWRCTCGEPFDTFATGGLCPRCGTQHYVTACPDCRQPSPLAAWYGQAGSFPVVFNTPPAFNSGETPQHNPQTPL
jgi:Zn-dependent protease